MKSFALFALLAFCGGSLSASLIWKDTHLVLPSEPGMEKLEYRFAFVNEGDRTVRILETKASCGCTVPVLEKKTYASGESGEIVATFTIGDRQGLQRKSVTVTTDDPAAPRVVLTLETDIPPLYEIMPRVVYWKRNESPDGRTITFRFFSDEPVELRQVRYNAEDIFAYEANEPEPNVFTFTATPANTQASRRGGVQIEAYIPSLKKTKRLYAYTYIR